MIILLCTLVAALVIPEVHSQQEKWVWSGRDSKTSVLARDDGKGRYGVYEPEIPDEPYNPPVRPPPPNLPPLIRPTPRPQPSPVHNININIPHQNNGAFQFPPSPGRPSNNNFNIIDNNRPYPPDFNNNRRPYPTTIGPSYPAGRPPVQRPSSNGDRPPFTVGIPPKRPEHPDNKDPTDFDKCKCVHSFNCKSPAILFGTCDTGKKYCCEKFTPQRLRGEDDYTHPDILVGPGGPIDPIAKGQGIYGQSGQGNSYGRLPRS
ncbi:hypothetical protein O3M35_010914 [Rhynocoris fuscipes]|uniref:Uncharacterized protein n=1 Tax=Rhynocoris fuscipes TaxID=488301 RepID=A0AAW1D670_9HEMI